MKEIGIIRVDNWVHYISILYSNIDRYWVTKIILILIQCF